MPAPMADARRSAIIQAIVRQQFKSLESGCPVAAGGGGLSQVAHIARSGTEPHPRRAHHATRSVLPTASNTWMTPLVMGLAKVRIAQPSREAMAVPSRGDTMRSGEKSVDPPMQGTYLSPRTVAKSHIIEPTGPVMGPNAVADVTPLGGRQELW
jgi:hypothetical protein